MDKTLKSWEERSRKYGYDIRGVLPKSFPARANKYLDEWMYRQVRDQIEMINKENIKVLDLGCGYGRLSEKILTDFESTKTVGIDISKNYVSLYNMRLSPRGCAKKGDIRKLPFKNNEFDVVVMVTTLMYLTKPLDQKLAMDEIFRVLNDQGRFIIIERNSIGHWLVTLGGHIGKEISAVSFSNTYLSNLISKSGGKIFTKQGIPFWTLALPVLFFTNKFGSFLLKPIMTIIGIFDKAFAFLLTLSLYIAYSGHKIK